MRIKRFDMTLFRSKVARRIFVLFIFCALLPIAALGLISLSQVAGQLNKQSQRRLHQASKAVGMAIYERLLFLEAEMKMVASTLRAGIGSPIETLRDGFRENPKRRFKGLVLVSAPGRHDPLFGLVEDSPELRPAEKEHMRSGKTLVSTQHRPDFPSRVFMSTALDPERPGRGVLLGEINENYLWGIRDENTLPSMSELCVLDESSNALICTFPGRVSFPEQAAIQMARSASARFEWRQGQQEYVASYWSIPLRFRFFADNWTVVLSESRADVLAPMANFKRTFPLVILLSLWVVVLLSISQIRRSLVPLEILQEGTRRIAMGDLTSRVTVRSADEFEELAASFNAMAARLRRQFHTLTTMAEIHRAILSMLDRGKVVETVLTRMQDVFPCECVSVTLLDSEATRTGRTFFRDSTPRAETLVQLIELTPEVAQALRDNPESLVIVDNIPHALVFPGRRDIKSLSILPIFFAQRLSGFITLGYHTPSRLSAEDTIHARQLADQVAVAIHNAQLYEEMTKLAADLSRSNKVKDEFLSVMSHELRTPLSVVMGYTGMVRDRLLGEINPEQGKALEKVLTRARDQLTMITSILQATQLEAEGVRVQSYEMSLGDLLDVLRSSYEVPPGKALSLDWDYPSNLPVIKTDGEKLKHILQNLIDNAIKFTERGRVSVSVRVREGGMQRAESNGGPVGRCVEYRVEDTGVGIPEEALPYIFEKFRQADSSETRTYGGVGLGLYIAKNYAELLGGNIKVESELGKGSTFTVTIPYDGSQPPVSTQPSIGSRPVTKELLDAEVRK